MRTVNLGQIVGAAWEEVLRETEDPFRRCLFELLLDGRGSSGPRYRERLDRQLINCYGEVIPRIVTVKRNLRKLGNIRLDPKRLV